MLFNTLAIGAVALSTLASAAPAPLDERQYLDEVVDGQVARAYCTDSVRDWYTGPIRGAVETFCQNPDAHTYEGNPRTMDIYQGEYFLSLDDSQGGDYKPCLKAFNWIIDNCVTQQKIGAYMTNANLYKVVPRAGL